MRPATMAVGILLDHSTERDIRPLACLPTKVFVDFIEHCQEPFIRIVWIGRHGMRDNARPEGYRTGSQEIQQQVRKREGAL